jgi:hypothetical protein
LAVGGAYLQVIAAKARVQSAQSQLETANALLDQTSHSRRLFPRCFQPKHLLGFQEIAIFIRSDSHCLDRGWPGLYPRLLKQIVVAATLARRDDL